MATGDLCLADDVAKWLGLKSSSDDTLIDSLVTSISAAVVNQIARPILSASYTETRNGRGHAAIMAINYPITAVASVAVDGNAIPARPSIGSPGYTFDEDTIYLDGYCFERGRMNVVLQYTAGYATVPVDLAQAVVESIASLYRQRDRIGLSAKGMAGETTSYLRDLPPELMRRIMTFARPALPPT